MDDNDFYEDDESAEEVEAAWRAGERGLKTGGHRDLNQRAMAIVDRAVGGSDDQDESNPTFLVIVKTGTASTASDPGRQAQPVPGIKYELVG